MIYSQDAMHADNETDSVPVNARSSEHCADMERELNKSRRLLSEAEMVGHIGSWEWDPAANSMTWSDEMFRIFGLTPRQLNPTIEEVLAHIHHEDRPVVESRLQSALLHSEPFSFEARIIRHDSTLRVLLTRGEVIVRGS